MNVLHVITLLNYVLILNACRHEQLSLYRQYFQEGCCGVYMPCRPFVFISIFTWAISVDHSLVADTSLLINWPSALRVSLFADVFLSIYSLRVLGLTEHSRKIFY